MINVSFLQAGQITRTIDSAQPAQSVPLRSYDFRSCSIQLIGAAQVAGKAEYLISNADIRDGKLLEPAEWFPVDALALTIGPGQLPSFMRTLFNDVEWLALRWTPNGGSGALSARLGGVRR